MARGVGDSPDGLQAMFAKCTGVPEQVVAEFYKKRAMNVPVANSASLPSPGYVRFLRAQGGQETW